MLRSGNRLAKVLHFCFGARYPFKMSALSPTMESGTIAEWLVKEGDYVELEGGIAIIETDKAKVKLESAESGYIAKLLFEQGTKDIGVGQVIGYLVEDKNDLKDFKIEETESLTKETKKEMETPKINTNETKTDSNIDIINSEVLNKLFISPRAKMIAKEMNIALESSNIKGTGPNGRIISENVLNYKDQKPKKETALKVQTSELKESLDWTEIKPSNTRKIIAKRLSESKRDIPHFYLTSSINMDNLLEFKQSIQKETNVKLSVNDFLIKAVALACQKIPETRSQWIDGTIRQFKESDICFAVDSPSGLITPKINSAQNKSLSVINNESKDLITRAKENNLKPEEFMGGTFTISNLGSFGVESFSAVINPPQSCILAVGSTRPHAIPIEGESTGVKWIKQMTVTLSCDHRVVDGAVGARWLKEFKTILENPLLLVV